jgi:hypothetical protein
MNRCLNSFCRSAVNLSTGTLVLAGSRPIWIGMSFMSNGSIGAPRGLFFDGDFR